MSLTFKAFLYERTWRGDPIEIRRFTIDQDVSSSFAYLVEKVVQVFPSLKATNVVIAWTDSDGDIITISSDEELVQALDQFEGSIFRLYLKKGSGSTFSAPPPNAQPGDAGGQDVPTDSPAPDSTPTETQQQQQGSFHPGVVCDGCSGAIYGTRFKCLVCRDYDLCSGCEGKGVHVDHNMLTITDPWSYSPWGVGGFYPHWSRGPFRGRGGCCKGGRFGGPHGGGHHGGGHHGGRHHGGHHGFYTPWAAGFARGGAGCHGNQYTGCHGTTPAPATGDQTEGQEPMDTAAEQKEEGPTEQDRKSFLRGVGEAVSNFLEPFGVKVDVDVLGGDKSSDPPASAADAGVSDEVIEETLAQMKSMGYQDEEGWLKELVRAKGGDLAKVLDALHPTVEEQD